jgi:hypothetical protein
VAAAESESARTTSIASLMGISAMADTTVPTPRNTWWPLPTSGVPVIEPDTPTSLIANKIRGNQEAFRKDDSDE